MVFAKQAALRQYGNARLGEVARTCRQMVIPVIQARIAKRIKNPRQSKNMQLDTILLKTNRLILTTPGLDDAEAILDYQQRNRLNFKPWEPTRDDAYYTVENVRARIQSLREKVLAQQSLHLLMREPASAKVIAECGFTNIVRGPFQACHLGFSICQDYHGRGLMAEGLRGALDFVFGELGLHRVMANYRPENDRSHQLLRRLGFEQEGRARAYLKIDGQWRDHILTSLINPAAQA